MPSAHAAFLVYSVFKMLGPQVHRRLLGAVGADPVCFIKKQVAISNVSGAVLPSSWALVVPSLRRSNLADTMTMPQRVHREFLEIN